MLKKLKLRRAAKVITAADSESGAATRKSFFYRIWTAVKWFFRAIFTTVPRAVWRWISRRDIIGLSNCALMLLIIVLFSMLIGQVLDVKDADNGSHFFKNATADNAAQTDAQKRVVVTIKPVKKANPQPTKVTVGAPAHVTFDKDADKLIISLPLKKIVTPAIKSGIIEPKAAPAQKHAPKRVKLLLVENVHIVGDTIIDFANGGDRIASGTRIYGNLFLQNARYYTLPCGVVIDGDIYLRNMGQVRFCGEFTVRGNIYVSHNSSFGPIPRNARLGGQVIF
ncbi:MAG: hypothetical protein LBK26_01010 [Rickettsiales bacterium]|jgi:hypothetical protein|nr:hypothetical protein [Rickettsiales bacterium]